MGRFFFSRHQKSVETRQTYKSTGVAAGLGTALTLVYLGGHWRVHSLKLTHCPLKLVNSTGNSSEPTIGFQVLLLLVSGRVRGRSLVVFGCRFLEAASGGEAKEMSKSIAGYFWWYCFFLLFKDWHRIEFEHESLSVVIYIYMYKNIFIYTHNISNISEYLLRDRVNKDGNKLQSIHVSFPWKDLSLPHLFGKSCWCACCLMCFLM